MCVYTVCLTLFLPLWSSDSSPSGFMCVYTVCLTLFLPLWSLTHPRRASCVCIQYASLSFCLCAVVIMFWASQVAQWQRICLPVLQMQETCVQPLGQDDPLEEEMATHSNILAWKILWTEEPGGLQSMWSQKSQTQLSNWVHIVIYFTSTHIINFTVNFFSLFYSA